MKHSNHVIKKGLSYFAIVAMPLAISCSQPERAYRDKEVEAVDSNVSTTTKAQISTADVNMDGHEKAFITSAYSQSLYTQELANLGAKSSNVALRSLAKTVTTDQTKLLQDLEKIAKGKGLLLERSLSAMQRKELDALKELSSPTLDQQFLQKLQGLQSGATMIYQEGQNLKSEILNDYANNAIKMVHVQQETTAKLVKTVIGTNSQGTRPGEVATQN